MQESPGSSCSTEPKSPGRTYVRVVLTAGMVGTQVGNLFAATAVKKVFESKLKAQGWYRFSELEFFLFFCFQNEKAVKVADTYRDTGRKCFREKVLVRKKRPPESIPLVSTVFREKTRQNRRSHSCAKSTRFYRCSGTISAAAGTGVGVPSRHHQRFLRGGGSNGRAFRGAPVSTSTLHSKGLCTVGSTEPD